MFISFPCSRKVFNVWISILIIASFCNKFPGPIIGFLLVMLLVFINLAKKLDLKKRIDTMEETGLFPIETIFSIALALKDKIKILKKDNDIDSFKSIFNSFLYVTENEFTEFNFKKVEILSTENVKPIIKYIEHQIASIKQQMTPDNENILEKQLNAYFLLLVLCYNKFYCDLNDITKEIFKELD